MWCGSRLALSSEPSQEAATILRSFWEVHAVSWDLFVVASVVFGFVRDFELSTAVDACLGRLHDGGVDLRDQRSCRWHGVHLRGAGAEWCGLGPWSVASEPVAPGPGASVVITGTRGTVQGKSGVIVEGTTTGLVGAMVTPCFCFPGQSSYVEGTGTRTVDAEGRFTWERRTGKRIYVYFRSDDAKSNRLAIDR